VSADEVAVPRVVGLDLSLTATGIAYRDGATATIRTRPVDGDRRLLHITAAVLIAIGGETTGLGPAPDLVVIEDLPTHARAAGIVGMVHGAVRAALLDAGVPYAVVPPATLKAYATGRGNGDKTSMAIAALKRAGLEFGDDNECDAWWLRAAGLDHLGAPAFTLPAAQRDRLAKVTWPVTGRSVP
jgi:Holliday junction resolvasome RuvABC endonuclease subunit